MAENSIPDIAPAVVAADIEALFHARYGALVRLAQTLVDERAEAEEVVQESFERLYARVRRSGDIQQLEFFLHRTVLNGARSRLRRRRTARAKAPVLRAEARHVSDPLGTHATTHTIRDAVRRLPRRQQECVVLHYFEALPVDRIAAVLGIASGSVKKHLSRGRDALAEELGGLR